MAQRIVLGNPVVDLVRQRVSCRSFDGRPLEAALLDELIGARFLVPEGTDEFSFYRSVLTLLKLHDRKNRKTAYTILPTLGITIEM